MASPCPSFLVAGAPCFHARNGGHGLPELANHVHLCSPMFTLYQPYDWLHSRTSRSQLGRSGRRQRLNWMASMEKIAPSANWLKQFQAMRLASRPVLYRCNHKRVCHHQRKTRTELSLKSTGTLPNAKRQKEARGRKPKKSRSASRNTQQTFAIFLDCTVETPSQELASMKRSAAVNNKERTAFKIFRV